MEFLGVGMSELIVILLLMLVIGGPKRMLQWAYTAGQYVAKLRGMWGEVMAQVQTELDEAGVKVQVPRDIPTRATINRTVQRHVSQAMAPVTVPLQQTLNDARVEVPPTPTKPSTIVDQRSLEPTADLGTWSHSSERLSS